MRHRSREAAARDGKGRLLLPPSSRHFGCGDYQMSMRCSICTRPDRNRIDEALVGGTGIRDTAGQFAVSKSAVARHKRHVSAALVRASEAREVASADALMSHLKDLNRRALAILETAETSGKLEVALKAIRECRGIVETLVHVATELQVREQEFREVVAQVARRIIASLRRRLEEEIPDGATVGRVLRSVGLDLRAAYGGGSGLDGAGRPEGLDAEELEDGGLPPAA